MSSLTFAEAADAERSSLFCVKLGCQDRDRMVAVGPWSTNSGGSQVYNGVRMLRSNTCAERGTLSNGIQRTNTITQERVQWNVKLSDGNRMVKPKLCN